MGMHWSISCPYCNAEITQGSGSAGTLPPVFLPLFRCRMCNGLISTDRKEYLTIPVEERIRIKRSAENISYIEQSLDRTNSSEYLAFLSKNGFMIYPITQTDIDSFGNDRGNIFFESVRFDMLINNEPCATSMRLLYNAGILIEEEKKDKETGGFKKEVLEKNRRNYYLNRKSIGIGLGAGIVFAFLLGSITPWLSLLGIALGFLIAFFILLGMESYYENKEKNADIKQKEKEVSPGGKTDDDKVFIEYQEKKDE